MVKGIGNPIFASITFKCLLYPLNILETLFNIVVFLGGFLNTPKMYSLSLFPIMSINSLKGCIIGIGSFLTVFVLFSIFYLTNEIISSSISVQLNCKTSDILMLFRKNRLSNVYVPSLDTLYQKS
jgi:hypothetical protein